MKKLMNSQKKCLVNKITFHLI